MYTAVICVNHTPHISSLGPSVFCLLCIFATFRRSPFSFPNINGSTMPPLILNLSSATELRPRPLLRQKKTEWERSWRGKQDCKKGFERHKYISWRWLSLTVCKCSPVLQGPLSVVSQNQSCRMQPVDWPNTQQNAFFFLNCGLADCGPQQSLVRWLTLTLPKIILSD